MSVLIIEDDMPFGELIQATLGLTNVRFAHTMRDALALIDQLPPEVILLDLSLPDSPVEKTLQRIREIKTRSKEASVIVITGHPEVGQLEAGAQKDGAQCVLSKDKGFFNSLSEAIIASGRSKVGCASEPIVRQIEETVEKIVGQRRG